MKILKKFQITQKERETIEKTFEEKFSGNGMYDIRFKDADGKSFNVDAVLISIDGDWKHAHGYADYLMEELGYKCEYQGVTEEDGSDWYTATHGYVKTGA